MNSQQIKEILLSEIHEVSINYEKYCNNPKRDFSRKRKLILSILVDTFISKISLTMQPGPKIDSISGA